MPTAVGDTNSDAVTASVNPDTADAPTLEVMTFNLRYASPRPPNAWHQRRDACIELIRRREPDLIGTQEGLFEQLKDLDRALPEFARIGIGRDGGSRGEFMAVYYRHERLEPLEYDHFWLSDTPRVIGSRSFDADLARMVTWVRFKDLRSEREFVVANTHLDHEHALARQKSADLLRDWAATLAASTPILLLGDFNAAAPADPIYRMLVGADAFADTFVTAHQPGAEGGTFHDFRGGDGGPRIDWILARGPITTLRASIVRDARDGQYPSDHYPVTATVRIAAR